MESVQVAAAIIYRNGKVLIAKRPISKHKGGMWEFPGGKIESGESEQAALARELKEELNIEIQAASLFREIYHEYPEKKVSLKFYLVTDFSGKPAGLEGQPILWVELDKLSEYAFPEAKMPVVTQLVRQGIAIKVD